MKAVFVLALIALGCVCAQTVPNGCDSDSNGKPDCSTDSEGIYRNFWDPVHYWQCTSRSSDAVEVACPTAHLFNPETKECVMWNVWSWVTPCPPVSS